MLYINLPRHTNKNKCYFNSEIIEYNIYVYFKYFKYFII